jgi:hypothetical protein
VADYVQLGDVHRYYEEGGQGEPLVLPHHGGADSRVFGSNLPGLIEHLRVFRPDQRGHGGTADVESPISNKLTAQDTIAFLEHPVGRAGVPRRPLAALNAKLDRMEEEPHANGDRSGHPGSSLVMVGRRCPPSRWAGGESGHSRVPGTGGRM